MLPIKLPVLICTLKVSAPSVVLSAVGLTVKLPALLLMVKLPALVPKSALLVVIWLLVQYNVVPFATLLVVTFIVTLLPSLTLLFAGLAL